MPSLVILLEYLEKVNAVSGLVLTSILLYAIRWFSGPNLGSYKNLLTTFAVTDLFLIVLHAVVRPRTVLVGTTHGVSTDTIVDDRRVTAIYIAFQSVPFTLLIIHFLYRYWSVRRRHLLYLFSNKAFILVLATGIVGELNAWFMMSMYVTTDPKDSVGRDALTKECERKYDRHIEHAWIILDHWRNERLDSKLFVTVIITNALMFSSIILASTLAFLTFHHLKYIDASSIQFNLLQRKLMVALCVQAAVPLLFVHIPSLIAINLPFFRLCGGPIHDFVSPIYTCFPVWDAAAILLLISDYRRGLLWMIDPIIKKLLELRTVEKVVVAK